MEKKHSSVWTAKIGWSIRRGFMTQIGLYTTRMVAWNRMSRNIEGEKANNFKTKPIDGSKLLHYTLLVDECSHNFCVSFFVTHVSVIWDMPNTDTDTDVKYLFKLISSTKAHDPYIPELKWLWLIFLQIFHIWYRCKEYIQQRVWCVRHNI